MASIAFPSADPRNRDQAFFFRIAAGIAVFVLFAFAQWSARGFVDFGRVPLWVHLHAVVMVSWLGLFVVQARLATTGNLALHRRLGWLATLVIIAIPLVGLYAAFRSVELHRMPPFFATGYYVMLNITDATAFVLTAGAAIALRRQTDWHRRLMLVATIVLMEPAFGRLLPMPFMGIWGPITERVLQAAVLAVAMRHDRRTRGSVHPALWWGLALLVASFLTIEVGSHNAAVVAYADALAGAGPHP